MFADHPPVELPRIESPYSRIAVARVMSYSQIECDQGALRLIEEPGTSAIVLHYKIPIPLVLRHNVR